MVLQIVEEEREIGVRWRRLEHLRGRRFSRGEAGKQQHAGEGGGVKESMRHHDYEPGLFSGCAGTSRRKMLNARRAVRPSGSNPLVAPCRISASDCAAGAIGSAPSGKPSVGFSGMSFFVGSIVSLAERRTSAPIALLAS